MHKLGSSGNNARESRRRVRTRGGRGANRETDGELAQELRAQHVAERGVAGPSGRRPRDQEIEEREGQREAEKTEGPTRIIRPLVAGEGIRARSHLTEPPHR
jgi:hypothetical protein